MGISTIAIAYATVLLTELVGDRSIYTIGSLATRLGITAVLGGLVPAFMIKMAAAVLLGQLIAQLPPLLITAMTAASFIGAGVLIWRRRPALREGAVNANGPLRAAFVAFAAIALTEWADAGQIAAATLAARYQAPVQVWLGATLALTTKGGLGVLLGVGIRRYFPARVVRYAATCWCLAMGLASCIAILGRRS